MAHHQGSVVDGYLIRDAARLGLHTEKMVDYLCRQKVLIPSLSKGKRGRGRPRKYSFGDVVMLRVLARLLNAGVSVERIKRALQVLRKYHPEITPERLPAEYLVTDGVHVYLCDDKR